MAKIAWKAKAEELALNLVAAEKAIAQGINGTTARDRRIEELQAQLAVREERVQRAEKDRKDTIEKQQQHYADWKRTKQRLKAELAASVENVARLQGYVDRTLEDDAAREVGVIQDKGEARTLRRGPPPILRVAGAFDEVAPSRADLGYGVAQHERREKPWFDL